jgi:hypothetical protein
LHHENIVFYCRHNYRKLSVPAFAQPHSPVCDGERAKAKAAIAAMDHETDWISWYSSTRPKLNGQPLVPTDTGIIRQHDENMILAHKDRAQALQVMLDDQCFAAGSEKGFRDTIRKDQDAIKDLKDIEATQAEKSRNIEADAIAKVGLCGNLKIDLALNKDQINSNTSALAELSKNEGSIDRRKELGRDNVERLTKLTVAVRNYGEQCGMTAQEVEQIIDRSSVVIKMYDWAY